MTAFPFIVAFLIGAVIGLTELLSKYTWSAKAVLTSAPGWGYLSISGLSTLLAYSFAYSLDLLSPLALQGEYLRVVACSLMGTAVLRSSFANLKIEGGKEFSAGFQGILDVFRERAETSLDQRMQEDTIDLVSPIVENFSFFTSKEHFCALGIDLLQSVSPDKKESFYQAVAKLESSPVPDSTKMVLFSRMLIELTGEKLFRKIANQVEKDFGKANIESKNNEKFALERLVELKKAFED